MIDLGNYPSSQAYCTQQASIIMAEINIGMVCPSELIAFEYSWAGRQIAPEGDK